MKTFGLNKLMNWRMRTEVDSENLEQKYLFRFLINIYDIDVGQVEIYDQKNLLRYIVDELKQYLETSFPEFYLSKEIYDRDVTEHLEFSSYVDDISKIAVTAIDEDWEFSRSLEELYNLALKHGDEYFEVSITEITPKETVFSLKERTNE